MKVKILSEFRDKNDFSKHYKAGDVVDFSPERAKELQKLKLVDPMEVEKKESDDSDRTERRRSKDL